MDIYTSYFANTKKLIESGITPISIAVGSPRWWNAPEYKKIAPTWQMVKGNIGRKCYIAEFKKILANLDPCAVLLDLSSLAKDNDFALLCWEKPHDFCHRHIVADWLMENTGCTIKEFGIPENKSQTQEQSLF